MSKEEEFVPDYEDTEENPFEGIESFFDEVATGQGVVAAPTVIKSNNNASVDILYDKLKGMNYNLEELKEVMECKNTMLVKSIAGSGKSTAMILTIIRGLLSGEYLKTKRIKTAMGESEIVIPVNILVSTFLKSGAESLKKDFKMWVKKLGITGIDVDAIHFKTIHAEAYHALKDMGVNVSILENTDALIREIMKEFSIRSNLVKSRNITLEEVKDMGSIISYARNMLDPAKKYNHSLMAEYNLNPILLDAVLRSFAVKRRQSGKLDFEDMQESLLNAAKTNPNVAEFLGTRYDYIFVDEFQDTSDLQYELLKYYFKGAKRVVAIGDDDQLIYSFRGSDIDIILHKFEEDYKPDIKQLTTNYRCKENILNAVAPSITKNKFRLEKELRAAKPGGEVVVALNKDVNYLVDQILNSLGQNHTVGVLARTNAELLIPAILLELDGKINFSLSKSINLNNKLTRTIIGVMDLVTKRYTEDFGTYLKMFISKYDGFQGDKLADSLKINRGFNLFNIPDRDIKHSVPSLAPFLHGLREAKKIDDVSAYLYILEYMKSYVFTSNSTYAKNSREFINFMMGLILEHKDIKEYSLAELNELFTSTLPERFHRRVQYSGESLVKLTTVHEAKGKEWDTVIMWNVVVGSYPNEVGNKDLLETEKEEERRVFYIAWTRAKSRLIVFSESGRQSMFLEECNLENTTYEDSSQISSIRLKNKGKAEEELSVKDKLVNALNAYKEDVYNSNKSLTSVVLANLEIIDSALNTDSLADKLINEYGVGLDGKVWLTTNELDTYLNDIANKLIDGE